MGKKTDEAADFGRRRVPWWIFDARRNFSGVCARWRPVVLGLHRFFIAISRAVVNHNGVAGPALDLLVWSVGGAPKKRRVVHAVRDRAFLPGPAGIWDGEWGVVAATHITCHDAELWPYSVSMLVTWVAFLYTLHWPRGGADLGVGGVSYVVLLILYELWAGEMLDLWFRFRLLRRYLALRPTEVGRVYCLLEMVSEGSPGHGPVHLLSASAAEVGFRWDPLSMGWTWPGLPLLGNLAGPVQHFKAAILDAWRNKVAADLLW